jgi:ADP-heptose:LPS heptosyltransferase
VPLAWQLEEFAEASVLNLSNRYPNIGVLLGLLDRIDLHLTNDNGVMHLADVMDTPQIALFGHTSYRFFGPMGRSSRLVISPTGKMHDIKVSDVLSVCREHLSRAIPRRKQSGKRRIYKQHFPSYCLT